MKKVLFFICTLFFCIGTFSSAYGQNNELEGTWRIDRVIIKKTVNDVESVKTYYLSQDFKSFIKCPQKVAITSDEIIFEYKNGDMDYSPYLIKDDKIQRLFNSAIFDYEYNISGKNQIQLKNSTNYVNDGTENVKEEYTLYGHRES